MSPVTMTPIPEPTRHPLAKRHSFTCNGQTLDWESQWYTEPFFTSSRSSFDRAASRGPINPPQQVWETVAACQNQLGGGGEVVTTTNSDGVAVWTTITPSSSTAGTSTRTRTTTISSTSTTTSLTSTLATSTTGLLSASTTVMFSSTIASSATLVPSNTPSASSLTSTEPNSINTCAGDWDWQGWGVASSLVFGLLVGLILWLLWAILRSRMAAFFTPRTWAVAPESRPSTSKAWGVAAFLFPFLHMPALSSPTTPLEPGQISQRTIFTGLKLAALSSLIALGAGLPLIAAGVPCLGRTSPMNSLGGHLGTLTDLSLLRLLNALDPSPDSASTSTLLNVLDRRALSSTISPAISSARVRLIVILVLITIFSVGGGVFTIARAYAALARYRKDFEERLCGGLDMVFIADRYAPAWRGKTVEGLKAELGEWQRKWHTTREQHDGDRKDELEVVGVFPVPDQTVLRQRISERAKVLDEIEVAESQHIATAESQLGTKQETTLPGTVLSSDEKEPITPPSATDKFPSADPIVKPKPINLSTSGTKFVEINRDSAQFSGNFQIGQRVKMDDTGLFVPDPSTDGSDEGHGTPSSSEEIAGIASPSPPMAASDEIPSAPPGEGQPQVSEHETARTSSNALPQPSPTSLDRHTSPLDGYRHGAIRHLLQEYKGLNTEIVTLQQDVLEGIASGAPCAGWIIVGRGARWFPHVERIEGCTREDILWINTSKSRPSALLFWVQVAVLAFLLVLISVPVMALSVGSAPGFAKYLPLMRPLARSDGLGSGIAQGLAPALILSLLVIGAVFFIHRLAKKVRCISQTRQRFLAHKAAFWVLLVAATILPITIAALEFAVQGFSMHVQPGRSTGDGAIFSSWFAFVLLLNIAVIVPGLLLLQPVRLFRYLLSRRQATTPRRRYRRLSAPSFHPAVAIAPVLIAVFYASTLLFIFPLLAIPILLLLYLTFVVVHHQVEYLSAPSRYYEAAALALWTLRRFGWVLAFQPLLYGLVLLSRNEWTIGGISIGVAAIAVILTELVTVISHPAQRPPRRKTQAAASLRDLAARMARKSQGIQRSRPASQTSSGLRPRQSTSSMLQRFMTLLPGLARLPPDSPLPLRTEIIDDLQHTERAAHTRPDLAEDQFPRRGEEHDLMRGLIYPPEVMLPVPVIWLQWDKAGVAEKVVADLAKYYELEAIVEPPPRDQSDTHPRDGHGGREAGEARLDTAAGEELERKEPGSSDLKR